MKSLYAYFALLLLGNQISSGNFLWAEKKFWLKSHADWEKQIIEKEKPPFVTEVILLKPKMKTFLGRPMFNVQLIVVGERVMAYSMNKADGTQMTLEEIKSCMKGCSKKNAPWGKPTQDEDLITWMREDNEVVVEFHKKEGTLIIYDIGFYMIDKTYYKAIEMKENGMGDDWFELNKTND